MIEIISPAGFENYFAEVADAVAIAGGLPAPEIRTAIAARYGLEFNLTDVPDIVAARPDTALSLGPDRVPPWTLVRRAAPVHAQEHRVPEPHTSLRCKGFACPCDPMESVAPTI